MNDPLLNAPYSHGVAVRLLEALFPDYVPLQEAKTIGLGDTKQRKIQFARRLGEINRLESEDLDEPIRVYEFVHSGKRDPRLTLSRESFHILADQGFETALCFFVPKGGEELYRFSLVKIELEEGKLKRSSPFRYSFLMGKGVPTHTLNTYLLKTDGQRAVQDLDDLFERFSIEPVNRDFYRHIKDHFDSLKTTMRLPEEDDPNAFGIRLIGRIIFCWFLKKKVSEADKPLVPEGVLSSASARKNGQAYYSGTLEPLFFEVLNKPHRDRRPDIKADPNFQQIPYLNGGLFEAQEGDHYHPEQPAKLFTSSEWFRRLFETFEQYNFTIDENTSTDVEVSIDPEMLGKIFEELLWEINPSSGRAEEDPKKSKKGKNKNSERNKTGTYYTPRAIVDYLVEEALVYAITEKLQTKSAPSEAIVRGILDDTRELSDDQKRFVHDVRDELKQLKILDPACGSGAFTMGAVQKIVAVQMKLNDAQHAEKNNPKDLFHLKHTILQNCIFGVDINQSAVDIARLRAFLSLVVDQEVKDKEPNQGIEPLPNLEFKFVCANALRKGQFDSTKGSAGQMTIDVHYFERLRQIMHSYYNAHHADEKKKYKQDFLRVQEQSRLPEWNPFTDDRSPWFDEAMMFGVDRKFDVVLANPPYIQLQAMKKNPEQSTKDYKTYKTYDGMGDIYCLFYERGVELLKPDGMLAYITSNKWMRAGYGNKLRKYLLEGCELLQLIDLGPDMFDRATVDTNLLVLRRRPINHQHFTQSVLSDKARPQMASDLRGLVLDRKDTITSNKEDLFLMLKPEVLALKNKIEQIGQPLGEWDIQMNFGIKTGYNEAFIIDASKRNDLIAQDPRSAEIIKPLLRGKDIGRYRIDYKDKYLIATHNGYVDLGGKQHKHIDINNYPAVKAHLDQHQAAITKRQDQGATPYNLRACKYHADFEKEKIVWQRVTGEFSFVLVPKGTYVLDSTVFLVGKHLHYLLAILNSKVIDCYLRTYVHMLGNKGFLLSNQYVERIPIPHPDYAQKKLVKEIEFYVDHLNACPDDADFSDRIDDLVARLYDLTNYERKMIEGKENEDEEEEIWMPT